MNEDQKIKEYFDNKLNRVKSMTNLLNQNEDYKEHNCRLSDNQFKEFSKEALDLVHSSLNILLNTKNMDKKVFGEDAFETDNVYFNDKIFNDEIKALEKEIDNDYNNFPDCIKPYLQNDSITYVRK